MKYKVKNITIAQTREGKDYKRCDLIDEHGQEYLKVPYWNSLPEYATVAIGSVIEGTITSTQNGNYTNHKLSLASAPKSFGGGMGKALMAEKSKTIAVAQDRKEKAIQTAQDRNEVMWAKFSAAEIIAHHPAYAELTEANLIWTLQNLTRAIFDFNPNTSLTAMQIDDITSTREVARAEQIKLADDEVNNIPF